MSRIGLDPFATPPEWRDSARRLRGRLAAPVTVWTARGEGGDVGVTVASVLVVEGEPALLLGLLGPLSDFYEALSTSRRFLVHVLAASQRRLAETFAGRYPTGDPFEHVGVAATPWGPRLEGVGTVAGCELVGGSEVGDSVLVRGAIGHLELAEPAPAPLVWHRGAYQRLERDDPGP